MTAWHVWRHPKPQGVAGRCIGARSDVRVDPRKAKRLAHRIRQYMRHHMRHHARRECGLPVVYTSPLQRSWAVGAWLRRWGWQHRVDARLSELDFGEWDGQPWAHISAAAVDAWCADFAHHAPGGGESVAALLARCAAFWADHAGDQPSACIVGHAGWVNAARWLTAHGGLLPTAAQWPQAVGYGVHVTVRGGPMLGPLPTLAGQVPTV